MGQALINPGKCAIVYGQINSKHPITKPTVVVAFSNNYKQNELVDFQQIEKNGYYSLYLPIGEYNIFVFSDIDGDSVYEQNECIGKLENDSLLHINISEKPYAIIGNIEILVDQRYPQNITYPFHKKVLSNQNPFESAYYPSGSLRSLNDPIFDAIVGKVGLYNPSAFLDRAGIYFYAIKERNLRKTPIVFVHGIGGTPRDFTSMVENIDTATFDPWFFYYPSGQSLDKIANIFYELFLSGRIIDMHHRKLIIIAHSMGGLVTQTAINRYAKEQHRRFLKHYITLATPFGGNDEAISGVENAPLVLPCWKDIASNSNFIKNISETPLPRHTSHHLFFGFKNSSNISSKESSDGTIILRSQLPYAIQSYATKIYGFNETHTSILKSPFVLNKINEILSKK